MRRLLCLNDGRGFTAEVETKWLFTVSLFYSEAGWRAECNCGLHFDCEHAYAAMTALMDGQEAPADTTPKNAVSPLEQRLAEKLKRKLRLEERLYVTKLQQLYEQCRRKGGIEAWQLAELGVRIVGYAWGPLELWPALPKDDYEFWLYLAHAFRERNAPIPDFLESITDFSSILEPLTRMQRRQAIARWQEQLRQVNQDRAATAGSPLDFRLVLTPEGAHLQWKFASEASFRRLKQSMAKRFADEYTAGTLEVLPEASVLWHPFYLTAQRTYHWSDRFQYHEPDARRLLNPWLRLPVLQDRVVTQDGQPVRRCCELLQWRLLPAETEQDDYRLHLALPDGAAPPPIWFTLPGRPTLYVTAQGIYGGPPALGGAVEITKINSIPAPALESPDGLNLISRLGLDLPPRIRWWHRTLVRSRPLAF